MMANQEWFEKNKNQVIEASTRASDILAQAVDLSIDALPVSALEGVHEALKGLETGRFRVVMIGQMKAGKSTLLNSILFGHQVLPASATPLTAKLTRVVHDEKAGAKVDFLSPEEWHELERRAWEEGRNDDEELWSYSRLVREAKASLEGEIQRLLGTQRDISFTDLAQYVAAPNEDMPEQGKYLHLTREVEIRYPHPFPPQTEFVDTPGTNDPNELREKITLDYLSRADAVVLVLYAGQPGQRSDINFIKEQLLPVGPGKIVLVLNKFDTITAGHERESLPDYLQHLVADALLVPDEYSGEVPPEFRRLIESARIFPISGMQALVGRSQANIPEGSFYYRRTCTSQGINSFEEAIERSGILELEQYLSRYLLEQKGQSLLRLPVGRCLAMLGTVKRLSRAAIEDIDLKLENFDKEATTIDQEARDLERQLDKIRAGFEDIKKIVSRRSALELDAGVKSAHMRLKEIEEDMKEAYSNRITNFRFGAFYESMDEMNVDLGWKSRSVKREMEGILQSNIDKLPFRLRNEIDQEVDHWPEITTLQSLSEQLRELSLVNIIIETPIIKILSRSDVTVTAFEHDRRKAQFQIALQKNLTQYIDDCQRIVIEGARQAEKDITEKAGPVFDTVLHRLEGQLADIREAAELKRSDPAVIVQKKTELQQRRATVERLSADINTHLQVLEELWQTLGGDDDVTE